MILDPIWQLYDAAVVCGDPERAAKMATKVSAVVVIMVYYVCMHIICLMCIRVYTAMPLINKSF